MMNVDEALQCADDSEMNTGPERILAAEVRRLRDDAASTAGKIIKMTIEHDWAIGEAKRLQAENERLRKDAERIDWISRQDFDALCLSLVLDAPHAGEYYVCGDDNDEGYGLTFRAAIDAARGAK